ncbi:hypothetical protein [Micromonospora chersina]|uniref:hypothetical protein n=1 Tax=Micromonospora chersina TaxID=47854 RepID=UPI00371D9DDC
MVRDLQATGFNTRGWVTGNRMLGPGLSAAYVVAKGTLIRLQSHSKSAPTTVATGINDAGTVAGHYAPGNYWHAFTVAGEDTDGDGEPDRWFKDDNNNDGKNELWKDLGSLEAAGNPTSAVYAVNDGGKVTGLSYVGPVHHAFVNGDKGLEDLTPGATIVSRGWDINNVGVVVGAQRNAQGTSPLDHAILFPHTGLVPPGPLSPSSATSVDDVGHVVGTTGGGMGFVWDQFERSPASASGSAQARRPYPPGAYRHRQSRFYPRLRRATTGAACTRRSTGWTSLILRAPCAGQPRFDQRVRARRPQRGRRQRRAGAGTL